MSRLLSFAFVFVAFVAISAPTNGQISIWEDDDPASSGVTGFSGGLSVSQIADPTGDAARTTVGDVSTSATTQSFSNFRPEPSAPQPVPTAFAGKTYSFTVDYYVPTSSSMQNNVNQTFFITANFRDASNTPVEQLNNGFINYNTAMLDTWQTLEITGVVPEGVDNVVPLFIFNNDGTPQSGTAIYVDNVNFVVEGVAIENNPIWVDDDPATVDVTGATGDVTITQIADPTGDADRVTVGEIDHSTSTQQFTNMRPEPAARQVIDSALVGEPYSFTIDYYVPSTGTMQTNQTQSFFITVEFYDVDNTQIEKVNNGFINFNNAQLDTWQQLSISGVIPEGTSEVVSILIQNNQNALTPGAAFYVDNVNFSVQTIVDVVDETLKGDVDLSGTVDFADIPAFISVLQGGTVQAEADCDCNEVVDFADIPAFIAILQGG